MPFISLFYPASDAAEHFVEGQHLEIAGPMFRTYAEAVRELEQETSDVFEQGLPVEPYVLEVKALRGGGGYSIVEVYEVSFPTMRGGARARNPREPKMVEMPELRGIRTGADRQLTLDEAAAVYGDFMAHNLPLGVPAGKVRRAFGAAVTPPSVERHRHEAAAIKQKAVGKVSSSVTKAVEAHGVDGATALTKEKLEAVAEALDAGQITAAQAAPIIALESKRLEILDILQRFCPPVGEEGAAAIYEVTRAIFGGDEAAAEAGRLVLESVSSRFSSRPVEVDDSAVPAPKKGRTASKAAKTSAAGAAVFTGNVTDFVKAYGSRIRGDAKLAKAIVANAVGLAPFPVGFPVAELRDATSDVYALLAEAGVIAPAAVYSAPVYIPEPEPEPEPLPVAQFDDPGLQAIFGGLPRKPLPVQPDDYIMREYSYETGLPVYGMSFEGKLPPDRTPDLAQAIAVAERAGVQTHTYYDTALQSGGADFRPIAEAWERDAAERRFSTQIVEMPSGAASGAVAGRIDREIERVIADLLGQKRISDDRGVRVYSADTLDRRSVEELFEHLRAARDSKARYLEINYYLRQTYPYLRPFVDEAEVERDKAEARWLQKQAEGRSLSQTPFTDNDILDAASQGVTNTLVERLFVLVKRLEDSASALGFITDGRGLSSLSVEQQSAAAYGLAEDAAGDAFAPADSPPQSSAEIALNLMTLIAPPSQTPARLLPSYQPAAPAKPRRAAKTAPVAMPVPEPPPAPAPVAEPYQIERHRRDAEAVETQRLQELGLSVVPGIRGEEAEMAGRLWERLQSGDLARSRWEDWLEQLKRANKIRTAPALVAPSVSAEEQLAAKIAASNDAGLARLQAMLNG